MSRKSRYAPGMIAAAAVATVGIGLAPVTPAYADTGNGTVATLAITQAKRPVGPVQRLERAVVRIVREIFRRPVRKEQAQKAK
jgi:hypothetical protein